MISVIKVKKRKAKSEGIVSNRIRFYLNKQEMNQQELADITGYDSAHLSRIINGKLKNLTYTTLIDISAALKTPPSKVFIYKPTIK